MEKHFEYIILKNTNNIFRVFFMSEIDKNNENKSKDKVSLEYNLEVEREDVKTAKKQGYDFVPRFNHWLSMDEQKIKVEEIEKKTK